MKEITIHQFCDEFTQGAAAQHLGCTQSAVSQMLEAKRDIRLVFDEHGVFQKSYELKVKTTAA